jgi:hypothetical protein
MATDKDVKVEVLKGFDSISLARKVVRIAIAGLLSYLNTIFVGSGLLQCRSVRLMARSLPLRVNPLQWFNYLLRLCFGKVDRFPLLHG